MVNPYGRALEAGESRQLFSPELYYKLTSEAVMELFLCYALLNESVGAPSISLALAGVSITCVLRLGSTPPGSCAAGFSTTKSGEGLPSVSTRLEGSPATLFSFWTSVLGIGKDNASIKELCAQNPTLCRELQTVTQTAMKWRQLHEVGGCVAHIALGGIQASLGSVSFSNIDGPPLWETSFTSGIL